MQSPQFHSDLLTAREPDRGRAGSPLHAFVAMPMAKQITVMAECSRVAQRRGEVFGEGWACLTRNERPTSTEPSKL